MWSLLMTGPDAMGFQGCLAGEGQFFCCCCFGFLKKFAYLATLGLSCSTWDLELHILWGLVP